MLLNLTQSSPVATSDPKGRILEVPMEVTIEQTAPYSRSVAIQVPTELVEACFQRIVKKVAKEAQLPGFRKGHVPAQLVAKQFAQYIQSEVSQALVEQSLLEVSEQHKLYIIDSPKVVVHQLKRGEPMSFTADMEVLPTVTDLNYKQLPIPLPPKAIEAADVEAELSKIAREKGTIEPVDGRDVVAAKDLVLLDCSGTVDGEATDYGSESNSLVDTDATHTVATLPAFLIGKQVPGSYNFDWSVDQDFPEETLAGKTVTYSLTLHDIKQRSVPPLDDNFAQDNGHETLADLQAATKVDLEETRQKTYRKQQEDAVWAALLVKNPIEVPPSMVQQASQRMVQNILRYMGNTPLTKEQLQHFHESSKPEATRQVQTAVLMRAIVTQENLNITEDEVEQRMQSLLSERSDPQWRANVLSYYAKEENLDQLKQNLLQDKVTALLLEHGVETAAAETSTQEPDPDA